VTDRGKTAVALPEGLSQVVSEGLQAVTKHWQKLKRQMDREGRGREREAQAWLRQQQSRQMNIKEAAWQVMEQAYLLASDNGTLPANARQIMYAARPLISELITRQLDSVYFTQHLLPDFLEAHRDRTAGWDVVFDARGHFKEPHTGYQFGLGTLEVRSYLQACRRGTCRLCLEHSRSHTLSRREDQPSAITTRFSSRKKAFIHC